MQVPIFKIFVGWRPKEVPKVPVFFGLKGTLQLIVIMWLTNNPTTCNTFTDKNRNQHFYYCAT